MRKLNEDQLQGLVDEQYYWDSLNDYNGLTD